VTVAAIATMRRLPRLRAAVRDDMAVAPPMRIAVDACPGVLVTRSEV
jgi:hypothetical protein